MQKNLTKKELNFVLEQNHYFKKGTKGACVQIRDFLRHVTISEGQIRSRSSCVTADEFIEAVNVLMAFAIQQPEDVIPERWACDNDCRRTSSLFCPGECSLSKDTNERCPYFMDERFI
ncbi:MAG: hypothetical protein HFJ43_00605 [Clostridia bacterium]|nr:hypothetical protein [Clostridia bacterium]